MKNFSFLLFFLFLTTNVFTQDTPNCNASTLQLESLEFEFTEVIVNLVFSAEAGVISYDLQHDFTAAGAPMTEVISADDLAISLSFSHNGVHTFTALNRCTDGSTHTGSTFSIDFGQAGPGELCPPPTNLVIDQFNPGFVLFHWDNADSVDFWQVSYEPEGLATQNFTVEDPQVEQVLAPSVRHTFALTAVCDDEVLSPLLTQTFSPTIRFSLIIIEDIKLLPIGCDSLTKISCSAYRMACTLHGDFGPNKEAYLYTHECQDCTTATSVAEVDARQSLCWKAYPKPTKNQLFLDFCLAQSTTVQFTLYDVIGRLVWQAEPSWVPAGNIQGHPLYFQDLPAGLYWLSTRLEGQIVLEKIIIR